MSATYQITSLTTLETRTAPLDELSRNLMLNSIVSCDGWPLGLVTHWDLVFFSRTWAGWALEDCEGRVPEGVLVALSLVDRWLQDPRSVSGEELSAAAEAARAARAAWAAEASRAAWAAARAAEATRAAEAAGAAAGAAAAGAAAGAAAAGAAAAGAAWSAALDAAFQRQGRFIVEHLKNSSQTSFPSSAA